MSINSYLIFQYQEELPIKVLYPFLKDGILQPVSVTIMEEFYIEETTEGKLFAIH